MFSYFFVNFSDFRCNSFGFELSSLFDIENILIFLILVVVVIEVGL